MLNKVILAPAALAIVLAGGAARASGCIEDVKRDALYIHATVECKTNYMDTQAGYAALAGARECKQQGMTDKQIKKIVMTSFRDFDKMERIAGKQGACAAIGRIQTCMTTGQECGH